MKEFNYATMLDIVLMFDDSKSHFSNAYQEFLLGVKTGLDAFISVSEQYVDTGSDRTKTEVLKLARQVVKDAFGPIEGVADKRERTIKAETLSSILEVLDEEIGLTDDTTEEGKMKVTTLSSIRRVLIFHISKPKNDDTSEPSVRKVTIE